MKGSGRHRTMNPNIAQEIGLLREFLGQQNDLGIVIGQHQNLDTYAAALALQLTLTQAGKRVQIVSKKAPTVEVSNLVGIDKVRENFTAGNNSKLVISLPYIKGEVEKVLFTEHPDPQNPTNINFHLTAAPGRSITPFDLKDVRLIWDGGAPGAIIAIGVGNIDEIAQITDPTSAKIVNIDNFSGNTRFGDVVLVDETFSSLSEIIGKIVKDLSLPQDLDAAQNILDGVLYATRNFTKPNTSPLAFEAASAAMYIGAQRRGEMPQQAPQQNRGQQMPQQPHQNRGQQRVNDNDFPAMHMQGRNQQRSNQQRQQMPRAQQQFGQNRQQPQQNRGQQMSQQQPQQQFGQNPNDIEELMRKINEENARRQGGSQFGQRSQPQRQPQQNRGQQMPQQPMVNPMNDSMQDDIYNPTPADTQIVEPPMNAPIQDAQMPEEAPYQAPDPSEVPDDWLMPKVFKSSKNNN